MKKLFLSVFILPLTILAQEKGIVFAHSGWNDILAKAKQENKLVMLDAFTSWCGPCKWMAKEIFTQKEVGDYFNTTFVNAKIDMEKGEGIDIAKKYAVQAYPTFLFVNGDGELVHRICGGMPGDEFIKQAKVALDSENNFSGLKKKFQADAKKNAGAYFAAADNACADASDDLDKYFSSLKAEEIVNADNFSLLYKMVNTYYDPAFKYLHSNYGALTKAYGADTLNKKMFAAYNRAISMAPRMNNPQIYATIENSFAVLTNDKMKQQLSDMSKLMQIDQSKNQMAFLTAQADYVEKYQMNDPYALNHIAWDFYENVSDAALLKRACNWAKIASEKSPDYAVLDTYAHVLYKVGNKKEAKVQAEKAIAAAKTTGDDAKETQVLLDKINKEK